MPIDDNPFAPAEAGFRAGEALGRHDQLEPVPLDPGAILGRAFELVKRQPGLVVGAILIPIVPGLAFGGLDAVMQVVAEASGDETMMYAMVGGRLLVNLANWAVATFFALGQARIFMLVARGQEAELSMIIGEGRNYLSGLGVQLLVVLSTLLGFLLLVVPGIIVGLGLQFSLYAMLDRDMNPIEALQESWRLTDGYKFTIFAVNLIL